MIVLGRHRPLANDAWDESAVRAAIEEIVADAIANFQPVRYWPAHPSDSAFRWPRNYFGNALSLPSAPSGRGGLVSPNDRVSTNSCPYSLSA
jgi:hypothetical protein